MATRDIMDILEVVDKYHKEMMTLDGFEEMKAFKRVEQALKEARQIPSKYLFSLPETPHYPEYIKIKSKHALLLVEAFNRYFEAEDSISMEEAFKLNAKSKGASPSFKKYRTLQRNFIIASEVLALLDEDTTKTAAIEKVAEKRNMTPSAVRKIVSHK